MPNLRNYHILISHSWDYDDDYRVIKRWLDDANLFLWSDYSVPLTNPIDARSTVDLKEKIHSKIVNCSCVIVLAGMYAAYSKWIDYEIDEAVRLKKPIIGVAPRGQQHIPFKIQAEAKEVVRWNSASVVNAVRKYAVAH